MGLLYETTSVTSHRAFCRNVQRLEFGFFTHISLVAGARNATVGAMGRCLDGRTVGARTWLQQVAVFPKSNVKLYLNHNPALSQYRRNKLKMSLCQTCCIFMLPANTSSVSNNLELRLWTSDEYKSYSYSPFRSVFEKMCGSLGTKYSLRRVVNS